tara:strand:+ start:365 stop:850 length:486 start_codon:yes stop_codon:yes gene_type:complete
MRVVENALNEDVFSYCKKELESRLQEKESWWVSEGPYYTGSDIMASRILSETTQMITNELKRNIRDISKCNVSAKYMIWQPNSGINFHNDTGKGYGITIYMNDVWDPDYGGWFVWQDNNTQEWKTILPQRNLMVVNDIQEFHSVTPVSQQNRFTLQIWGRK